MIAVWRKPAQNYLYREGGYTLKWIHLKSKSWVGSATVMVPNGVSVWQFKEMVGLGEKSLLTAPSLAFPLPDQVVLDKYVSNFDTLFVE